MMITINDNNGSNYTETNNANIYDNNGSNKTMISENNFITL